MIVAWRTGHSRTIVGVEELTDGSLTLLIFDPGCRQMNKFQTSTDTGWLMHLLQRDVASLTARQYQILSVRGLISDQQDYIVSVNLPLPILSLLRHVYSTGMCLKAIVTSFI